ncbi:TIGR02234 family membrane protein [Streptantibioticus parmotrematis]|uniref:TIGR02234 family membrane protein n=1 Tax=Streptantibioticus parmotrematis TaxID=2873249 RepID=UPI0033DF753B
MSPAAVPPPRPSATAEPSAGGAPVETAEPSAPAETAEPSAGGASAEPSSGATPAEPSSDAAPRRRAPGRRSLAAALVSGAAGASVVLLAAGKTWATGSTLAAGSLIAIKASGKDVTGLPDALALVALAALVAVFAVRGAGRVVVSALLTLCGAGTVAACVAGASATGALDAAATRASGLSDSTVRHAAHTGWPWIAALGGLLLLAAGLLALARGAAWPAMGSRYERPGGPRAGRPGRAAPDPENPGEMWKALDRGEDPTQD